MKALPLFASLLALTLPLAPLAAQVATVPVGYVTHNLRRGLNLLGLTLHTPTLASGQLDSVNGQTLRDAAINGVTAQTGRTYILEIMSGTLKGTIQEIPAANIIANTLTTVDNLAAIGLATGAGYRLRLAPTLEEIFGTKSVENGGVLQAGITATAADLVWVPSGNGSYQKYYLRSVGNRFCLAGSTTPSLNVPLVYADGFIVEKKGTAAAKLLISGEVKTQGTTSVLSQGINTLGAVSPVGLSLSNAGLEKVLTKAATPELADLVWVQVTQGSNLSFRKYFLHTSGVWRLSTAPGTDLSSAQIAAVALNAGFLIERRGAPATLYLDVPASLAN